MPRETINEVCSNVSPIENVMNQDPTMIANFEVENDDYEILVRQ